MKKILSVVLLIVLAASFTAGCSSDFLSRKQNGPAAVATVGKEKLPVYEYEMKYLMAMGYTLDMAYENIINLKVQVLKAKEMGVELTEEEIVEIRSYSDQLIASMGKELFESQLQEIGVTTEEFNRIGELFSLVDKFKLKVLEEGTLFAGATDEESKLFYDNTYLRAKHILFKTIDDTNMPLAADLLAEVDKKANDTLAQIKAGKPFENFESESEDTGSAIYPDGYLFVNSSTMTDEQKSYMMQSQLTMVPEFEQGTVALENNAVSDLVKTTYGYHIIKRLDINEKPELFEQQKEFIKGYLNSDKYESVLKTWKESYKVNEDKKAMEAFEASMNVETNQ